MVRGGPRDGGLSMAEGSADRYSAGEQGLGYIFQPRFALLRLLELPESTSVLIEKDDDLDFADSDGGRTLGSLKHKAAGDRLSDLSTDFWKSVRIWLARYNRDGRSQSRLRFFYSRRPRFRRTLPFGVFCRITRGTRRVRCPNSRIIFWLRPSQSLSVKLPPSFMN